jgi:hypothetical protein
MSKGERARNFKNMQKDNYFSSSEGINLIHMLIKE